MESEVNEALIAKIRKLLAVADGKANENEAAVAARLAQELLEAHNLDMATIGRKKGTHEPRKDEKRAGGLYKWQRDLWYATATLNFCKYYYIRGLAAGSQYEHQLIGSHVNVVSTEVMGEYLEVTVERLARRWVHDNHPNRSIFIKEAIAFREGCARRISERLWTLRRENLAETAAKRKEDRERNLAKGIVTENALVLQDVINTEEDLNNDYINGWEPGKSAQMRKEGEARRAAAEKEAERLLKEHAEWEEANPVEAARRREALAKKEAQEYEAWLRAEKTRAKARQRKETAQEKRAKMPAFRDGYRKGEEVSLNRQVKHEERRKIK